MFSSSWNPDEQLLHSRLLQVEQREEEKEERGVTDSEGERQRGIEREGVGEKRRHEDYSEGCSFRLRKRKRGYRKYDGEKERSRKIGRL